jgi:hypothetical protein
MPAACLRSRRPLPGPAGALSCAGGSERRRRRAQVAKLLGLATGADWSLSRAFEHYLLHTGGRGILDELEKELGLAPDQARARARPPAPSPDLRSALASAHTAVVTQAAVCRACARCPSRGRACSAACAQLRLGLRSTLARAPQVAPARATLHRFGNTSAASTWCGARPPASLNPTAVTPASGRLLTSSTCAPQCGVTQQAATCVVLPCAATDGRARGAARARRCAPAADALRLCACPCCMPCCIG